MKIKNKLNMIIKGMLLSAIILMGMLPAMAATTDTQTATTDGNKEIEVLYTAGAFYSVAIPKAITLGEGKSSAYSVKVLGDIPSDKKVYVSPIDGVVDTADVTDFYMKDQSAKNPKADVRATIIHSKTLWDFQEAADGYTETNNSISASGLSAGAWKGTFNFEIRLDATAVVDTELLELQKIDPKGRRVTDYSVCPECGGAVAQYSEFSMYCCSNCDYEHFYICTDCNISSFYDSSSGTDITASMDCPKCNKSIGIKKIFGVGTCPHDVESVPDVDAGDGETPL